MGFTFFSYHLPISIFGIVDASRDKNFCYIADKLQAGPKSGNMTLNYIIEYVFELPTLLYHNTIFIIFN